MFYHLYYFQTHYCVIQSSVLMDLMVWPSSRPCKAMCFVLPTFTRRSPEDDDISYLSKPSCRIDLSHDEPETQHKKVFRTAQRSSREAKAQWNVCWLNWEPLAVDWVVKGFNSSLMEEKAFRKGKLILKHYEDFFFIRLTCIQPHLISFQGNSNSLGIC